MANEKVKTRVESVLEDPSEAAIARVYADAFLDAIPQGELQEAVDEFASFVNDVYVNSPDFKKLLDSAMVSKDEKLGLIDRITTGRTSPLFANFLRVLIRHDRLNLLEAIHRQTQLQHELRSGRRRVQVESAVPLNAALTTQLKSTLATMLKTDPIVELTVNPELLGGLRVRVGDTIYDSSLRARLSQMQARLRERSLNEIQSGRDRFSSH